MPSKAAIEFAKKMRYSDVSGDWNYDDAVCFDAFVKPLVEWREADLRESLWCYEQARKKRTLTTGEESDIKEFEQWLDYWVAKE